MSLTLHAFFIVPAIDFTETSMAISLLAFPTELFTAFVDKGLIPNIKLARFLNYQDIELPNEWR